MVLQVLVAHSGKKYELDCQGKTRVDVVQQALASLTAVPTQEQILLCKGNKLESAKTLGAYGLPSEQDDKRVFLYSKVALKTGSAPLSEGPPDEVQREVPIQPPAHLSGHPLDSASSPLIRALPFYERQFKFHLQQGQAIWAASQKRASICRRLVSEMHVQVLAIDSARESVDIHFDYISKAQAEFNNHFSRHHAEHSELLATFESEVDKLQKTALHPALRTTDRRSLLDCLPEGKLRSWSHGCERSHKHFEGKVSELSSLFNLLQRNVEELLMTGPDVEVAQLEEHLQDAQKYEEEETSILQSLSKDLCTVQRLVEETVTELSNTESMSSSIRPLDACAALDPMNELHTGSHLPQMEQCDAQLSKLVTYLSECKEVLSRNVHMQLQSISALQSKIRDLRYKQTAYKEVLERQVTAFMELKLARQVRPQYGACLHEIARRRAYTQLYSEQAGHLAERMAQIRAKEVARREAFIKYQERFFPTEFLQSMGIYNLPPQCEVTLPSATQDPLMDVSTQELTAFALELQPASIRASAQHSSIQRSLTASPRPPTSPTPPSSAEEKSTSSVVEPEMYELDELHPSLTTSTPTGSRPKLGSSVLPGQAPGIIMGQTGSSKKTSESEVSEMKTEEDDVDSVDEGVGEAVKKNDAVSMSSDGTAHQMAETSNDSEAGGQDRLPTTLDRDEASEGPANVNEGAEVSTSSHQQQCETRNKDQSEQTSSSEQTQDVKQSSDENAAFHSLLAYLAESLSQLPKSKDCEKSGVTCEDLERSIEQGPGEMSYESKLEDALRGIHAIHLDAGDGNKEVTDSDKGFEDPADILPKLSKLPPEMAQVACKLVQSVADIISSSQSQDG
mmetsp:Transcript_16373/g.19644  ORF Transcript_16373/g.19644 Transcript_16373/m.19644 type:complete len:850 (-) Transcript_16373:187-2736(-)|eukprot:CAMPEP_0197852932 /NCGR_PEP_ID=MMETSP1438-20131217/21742_1 /TAXON_ID=1461541 /ORGANISM="Pterosperma sp., Strain CCMP1384" /LENGTH=849 /DNA_ID=CAMNT_0043467165 /DNA_START=79 /DNA_END=2628 /DNA_ORIENTATION=+